MLATLVLGSLYETISRSNIRLNAAPTANVTHAPIITYQVKATAVN